jgi:hypothetical protein
VEWVGHAFTDDKGNNQYEEQGAEDAGGPTKEGHNKAFAWKCHAIPRIIN